MPITKQIKEFFEPDVKFWRSTFDLQENKAFLKNILKDPTQKKIKVQLQHDYEAMLANKRTINRIFSLLYHSRNITVNGHVPDIEIPVAHYLTRGYEIEFDLSALNASQRDSFWRNLIGEDNLAYANEAQARTQSKLSSFYSWGWDFLKRTFTYKHPYPSFTTSAGLGNVARFFGATVVSPVVAVLISPYLLYVAGKGIKDAAVGKVKQFTGSFESKGGNATKFRAVLNEKAKRLKVFFTSELAGNALAPEVKTFYDPDYQQAFKGVLNYEPATKNVCVIKVTPESIAHLEKNPQGITHEQLGLPPRFAAKKNTTTRQTEAQTWLTATNQLVANQASQIGLYVVQPSQALKKDEGQIVRIKLERFENRLDLQRLRKYFANKEYNVKSYYNYANQKPVGFRSIETSVELNGEKVTITLKVAANPIHLEFSNLSPGSAIAELALERAALMLSVALMDPGNTEEKQLIAKIASWLAEHTDQFFDVREFNSNLDVNKLKQVKDFWRKHYEKISQDIPRVNTNVGVYKRSHRNTNNANSRIISDHVSADVIWKVEHQDKFSSLSSSGERQALTNEVIENFKSNQNTDDFIKYLKGKEYFIVNDNWSKPARKYQQGNPIVERARAFVQASELWIQASADVHTKNNKSLFCYDEDDRAYQLRRKLNQLFWEFEAQSTHFPSDPGEQQKTLEHFLGKVTYLLYTDTKFAGKYKYPEEVALAKLYKELALAEALMTWQQGREEALITTFKSKDQATNDIYTTVLIDYPMSEITTEQYNELAAIYDPDETKRPKWFNNKKLPDFAREFLKKTLAQDPTVPSAQMKIADLNEIKKRYKSMPATLKLFLGVSNLSESHHLVFDEHKNLISHSIEIRSSSLAANEMHDLQMEKEVAVKNAHQVYLGEAKTKALELRDKYQKFWGISANDISAIKTDPNRSDYLKHTAPITLSASVLSPEHEMAKLARSVVSEINIDMLNIKDDAIQKLQPETQDNVGDPIIHLMGSNHIINGVRNWPRSAVQNLSIKARENSIYYLEQMEFLSDLFKNHAIANSATANNVTKGRLTAQQQKLEELQTSLYELRFALETHESIRRQYGLIPTIGKDYKFDTFIDQFDLNKAHWRNQINNIVNDPDFRANSKGEIGQFVNAYKEAFITDDSDITNDPNLDPQQKQQLKEAHAEQRAKDFLFGLHALLEYVRITNLLKESDPLIWGEDKNANLYRSSLERVFIRKMHGLAHVACKSGKDRTGIAVLMANAVERFWDIHGCIPQYNNADHWKKLVDYAADEFIAMHHQLISTLNSQGAKGLKSLKGMIPPLLKRRVIEKIAKIYLKKDAPTEKEIKAVGKLFFDENKVGSSINKPKPEFYNPDEVAKFKAEVAPDKFQNQDEYFLNMLINSHLADILRRVFAEQIGPNSTLFNIEKMDQLNEAIFRNVDFAQCLANVGLENLSPEDKDKLQDENERVAQNLLNSNISDEALLTRIWQFSRRQPQVLENDFVRMLEVKSLKEFVKLGGIEQVEQPILKPKIQPYVIPVESECETKLSIKTVPEDLLYERNATIGMGLGR